MKKICILLLVAFCLAACGGGGDDSSNNESQVRELALDETATEKIETVGDVDWYHIHVTNSERVMSVNLSGTHKNSPVEFMLTIYEKDLDGNLVTIFGESAKEEVLAEADITIDVPINGSRHLYFAVRDFKDDEASEQISYKLRATYSDEATDNDTFEDAIDLAVGPTQICYTEETVFPKSDVDCYRFTIGDGNAAGVYRISAQYNLTGNTPMPVNLDLKLYGADGELVQQFKGQKPTDHTYVLLPYLDEGSHFLVVADQGRDHESEIGYSICIEPVDAVEVNENDTASAENVDIDSLMVEGVDEKSCNLTGVLEYIQDEDWYGFNVTPAMGGASKNIMINFFNNFENGQVPDALRGQGKAAQYRITVLNENMEEVYSYDHSVLATEPNIVEMRAGAGERNYLMVKPIYHDQMLMAMPYQVNITLKDVSDENESEDPIVLESGVPATGKIAMLGDQDAYTIDVNTDSGPKILEVFLKADQPSEVSYTAIVQWGGKTRMLRDTSGTEEGTDFKSSFYIATTETVSITVSDDQNNDGSAVDYNLLVNVVDISELGSVPDAVSSPVYFSEPLERSGGTTVSVIEYNRVIQPEYQANTELLKVEALTDGQSWTSQWIAGFVDYDHDRDLFELNFEDVIPQGPDAPDWYCDIEIRMYAPASKVEYSWTLFRDAGPANNVLVERLYLENVGDDAFEHFPDGGGIVASWADMAITEETHDVTIPSDQKPEFNIPFWIGSNWGDSKFYFSINDYNRAVDSRVLAEDGENYIPIPNPVPDNDWGYPSSNDWGNPSPVEPYYFQVTVTYHLDEGCPGPVEEACSN